MSGFQVFLLHLQRKPCNRPKINFASIRRRQFSLTFLVMGWKKFFLNFFKFRVRLGRIQFSNAYFFRFVLRIDRLKKNHWTEFNLAMLIFFVLFWGLIAWKKIWAFLPLCLFRPFSLFSFTFFFNFLLTFVSQAVSLQPLDRI